MSWNSCRVTQPLQISISPHLKHPLEEIHGNLSVHKQMNCLEVSVDPPGHYQAWKVKRLELSEAVHQVFRWSRYTGRDSGRASEKENSVAGLGEWISGPLLSTYPPGFDRVRGYSSASYAAGVVLVPAMELSIVSSCFRAALWIALEACLVVNTCGRVYFIVSLPFSFDLPCW
jgi:hypothetical protein